MRELCNLVGGVGCVWVGWFYCYFVYGVSVGWCSDR